MSHIRQHDLSTMTDECHACGSENIVENDRNPAGNAQYHGPHCDAYRVVVPKSAEQPEHRMIAQSEVTTEDLLEWEQPDELRKIKP